MAQADEIDASKPGIGRRWSRRRSLFAVSLAALAVGAGLGWLSRETIVDRLVSGQLAGLGLPGSYTIGEIGAGRQVLTHVVLGDPAHPDFTADRVETEVGLAGWAPGFTRVTLVRPRLYGRWRDGKLSFGSLDRVIYAKTTAPFRLPNMALDVVDGRAGLALPQGAVGVGFNGSGLLRGGFVGQLAAVMPGVRAGDCLASGLRFAGRVSVTGERPELAGPLVLSNLNCRKAGVVLAQAKLDIAASGDPALDGGRVELALDAGANGPLRLAGGTARGIAGKVSLGLHQARIDANYQLALQDAAAGGVVARELALNGRLRSAQDLARIEADGGISGLGLAPGAGLNAQLAGWQKAGAGTLAAPLLAQLSGALQREGRDSKLAGHYVLRGHGSALSVIVPEAHVTGSSGARVLTLSRLAVDSAPGRGLGLSGNVTSGGPGLPHITARLEPLGRGRQMALVSMADYRAGSARLAMPDMRLTLGAGGLAIAGRIAVSGALRGGEAGNLALPVDGRWNGKSGLALWPKCVRPSIESLAFGNLRLEHETLALCPVGPVILALRNGQMRVAARVPGIDVAGHLGTAPVRISGGAAQLAYGGAAGAFSAKDLVVVLGGGQPGVEATRIALGSVDGKLGSALAGHFAGAEVALADVPLDITKGEGAWRYDKGVLTLDGAALTLTDREKLARFQPLVARGAHLRLEHGVIAGDMLLREPKSDREIVTATIQHELDSGRGSADLTLAGVTFDNKLQPDTLSPLALGVIANASGKVSGTGRIDWRPGKITSTGRFATPGLDFAAAVGPLKGVAGEVEFTDLLGLVTAPDQHLRIGAINPGIEVDDGELTYALLPGHVLAVKGAEWPFLDGRMFLMPTRMQLGASEVRRYEIRVSGMNAAKFIQHMDLSNLAATGVFDGSLPMVFDENGGRIEGGMLVSRPPGGSVSYVGELSYKDLSPMANYAFKALRALKYREMRIGMDGAIAGELVTRVAMKGVSQGEGTKRNFITNQLARLPLQFNVNLRAPFFQLITSFKSMYDPSYVRDPRALGLIGADGRALPAVPPPSLTPAQPAIQPPASEHLP